MLLAMADQILGFPYCYGVFRAYFFTHEPFEGIQYISVAGVAANVSLLRCTFFHTSLW